MMMMTTTIAALCIAEAALEAAWKRACAATARDTKRNREARAATAQWSEQARTDLAGALATPFGSKLPFGRSAPR